jgi:hypothetical protein
LEQGLKYGGASELSFVTPNGGENIKNTHLLMEEKERTNAAKKRSISSFVRPWNIHCPNCQNNYCDFLSLKLRANPPVNTEKLLL